MGSPGGAGRLRGASGAGAKHHPRSQIPRPVAGHPRWQVGGPDLRKPIAAPASRKQLAVAMQEYQLLHVVWAWAQTPGKVGCHG